jgi:tRNA/rRNA methyltransferase
MEDLASLDRVRVVLSHTSHPGNIGGAARAMKTMGLKRLVLVNPRHFPHDEAIARASGAEDLLVYARVVESLAQALEGCVFVAAVTARRRELSTPTRWARDAASELISAAGQGEVALVFGNETSGLSNEEVALTHIPVMIPANPDYSSLNLAAAVQILCYELRLAAADPGSPPPVAGEGLPATHEDVDRLVEHFERASIASGFLDPAVPKRLIPRLRRLFARARIEREEVAILRGMLSAFEQPQKKVD